MPGYNTPPMAGRATPPLAAPRSAEDTEEYLTRLKKSYYYDPAVFTPPASGPTNPMFASLGASAAATAGGTTTSFAGSCAPTPPLSGALGDAGGNTAPVGNGSFDELDAHTSNAMDAAAASASSPNSPSDWANGAFHKSGFHAVLTTSHMNVAGTRAGIVDTPPLQMQALSRCAIVTGNSHPQLAADVAALLGKDLHPVHVGCRSNGEISIKIIESVNDKDVFIVHSMCARDETHDINEGIMELMFLIRKLRQGYASTITAVVPNMAYGRQDHKSDLRVPISSASIAMMMMQMGVDRVVSLDLHSGQIQGSFNAVPVDSLSFLHEFAQHIRQQEWYDAPNTIIVSPDASGVERAKRLGDVIGATSVVTIVKRRLEGGKVDCMQAVGEVRGKCCIIVDDIIDSGKTLIAAVDLLKEMGAVRIIACVSHGIMTDKCSLKIAQCEGLSQLVVSDSIPQNDHKAICGSKLVVLPTAPLLAMSILQGLRNSSAGSLYSGPTDKEQLLKLVHAQLL